MATDSSCSPSSAWSSVSMCEGELSPWGYLSAPTWFPSAHNAHCDISQLFSNRHQIAESSSCVVFEAEYKGQIVAVKQIKRADDYNELAFATEMRCLSKLRHSNILGFVDVLMDGTFFYLIIEKADCDLYTALARNGSFCEEETKRIMYGVLSGIAYIHKNNLVHRDIKPENVCLIGSTPKLIDFGDAAIAIQGKTYDEIVGTPPFMSPERLREHNAMELKKADMWAVGALAFEMFCGRRCFEGSSQREVFANVLRGQWTWPTDRTPSKEMQQFVSLCLAMDAEQRLSAKEALQHQWFDGVCTDLK